MAKELAKQEASQLPVSNYDYGDDAGIGFGNQSTDDYSIPFVDILQGLSPELNTIEDAKPGHIINKVTGDVTSGKDGIAFIPCFTRHAYVEWKSRDAGGGYVREHAVDSPFVQELRQSQPLGKYKTPDGNELIETFYVYGVVVKPDTTLEQVILTFTSTKIGLYKNWMTKAKSIQIPLADGRRITPPLFAHRYRLKTQLIEKNGYKWHNWLITFDGADAAACRLPPNDGAYQFAKETARIVAEGLVKVDYSKQTQESSSAPSAGGMKPHPSDEQPPF